MRIAHHSDVYQEDIPRIVKPDAAMEYIKSSRSTTHSRTIWGLDSVLPGRGASIHRSQDDLWQLEKLLLSGTYFMLDDFETHTDSILFLGEISPFLPNGFREAIERLGKRQTLVKSSSSEPAFSEATATPVPAESASEQYSRLSREKRAAEARRKQANALNADKASGYGNHPDFIKGYKEHSENRDVSGMLSLTPIGSAADVINAGKDFINAPTLANAAMVAVSVMPGKYAEKIADELPLKKLDNATVKYRHTMKRFKVPCFEPGDTVKKTFKGRERELETHFARQLRHQEAGLNDLTVGEYIENRNRYRKMKRKRTGKAQGDFREDFSTDLKDSLYESYRKKMDAKEAEIEAEKRATEIMANLAALHDPDMIAGGADKVSRMGNSAVNKSLGGIWSGDSQKRKKEDPTSRLYQMDEQAQRALETLGPDAKMNVSLERCPLRPLRGKK